MLTNIVYQTLLHSHSHSCFSRYTVGIGKEGDHSETVIDKKNKIREEKEFWQKENTQRTADVHSLHFDVMTNKTIMKDKEGVKWNIHMCKEEHCELVSEPECHYLTSVMTIFSKIYGRELYMDSVI